METQPLVTISMPVFNGADTIGKALRLYFGANTPKSGDYFVG